MRTALSHIRALESALDASTEAAQAGKQNSKNLTVETELQKLKLRRTVDAKNNVGTIKKNSTASA
jgi:hypothetical protein